MNKKILLLVLWIFVLFSQQPNAQTIQLLSVFDSADNGLVPAFGTIGTHPSGQVLIDSAKWVTPSSFVGNVGWLLTGNSNITATALNTLGSTFLGTTTTNSLVFKTNNTLAGYIGSSSTDNLTFGINAGQSITTVTGQNTYIGNQAGQTNSTGTNNTFLGYQAGNLSTGNNNTLLGSQAGVKITSGARNTFVGTNAGSNITSNGDNTFAGYSAGSNYSTTQYGTFIGSGADAGKGSLTDITAIGYYCNCKSQ